MNALAKRAAGVFYFYRDGFRAMRLGRTLWAVIIIKLLVFLAVLNLYFPDVLHETYASDEARADHVLRRLTETLPSGPPAR